MYVFRARMIVPESLVSYCTTRNETIIIDTHTHIKLYIVGAVAQPRIWYTVRFGAAPLAHTQFIHSTVRLKRRQYWQKHSSLGKLSPWGMSPICLSHTVAQSTSNGRQVHFEQAHSLYNQLTPGCKSPYIKQTPTSTYSHLEASPWYLVKRTQFIQ